MFTFNKITFLYQKLIYWLTKASTSGWEIVVEIFLEESTKYIWRRAMVSGITGKIKKKIYELL